MVDPMSLFNLVAKFSNPLAWGGFALAVVFLIYGKILDNRTPSRAHKTHALIINRLFVIALVAMALGFMGFAIDRFRPSAPSTLPGQSQRKSDGTGTRTPSAPSPASPEPKPADPSRKTASEVFSVLQAIPRFSQDRFFNENYKDRKISSKGWTGTVEGEVSTVADETCSFLFSELKTEAKVLVKGCKAACKAQDQDRVTVQGALMDFESELLTLHCSNVKVRGS